MPRSLTRSAAGGTVRAVEALPWSADPATVFKLLADLPGAVFLDSSSRDFGALSRWSLLSACPTETLSFEGGRVLSVDRCGRHDLDADRADPFEALRLFIGRRSSPRECVYSQAPPLVDGVVGYLGYELGGVIERLPARPPPPVEHPKMWFGYYPAVLGYRHRDGSWWLGGRDRSSAEVDLADAVAQASVDHALRASNGDGVAPMPTAGFAAFGDVRIRPGVGEYLGAVRELLARIRAGDIYQANLCRQIEIVARVHNPAGLYLALRRANPAPFGMALKIADNGPWVLSSSPERFLRIEGHSIEVRPIKGTISRGRDEQEDQANVVALLASTKDAAELSMIVDVLRNDIGRVCQYGSVELAEHGKLESYARVHHLVSTVKGRLREDVDVVDVLRATFPGGSITGAPKIKAMELLAEIEPFGRGVYTGSMGYVDSSGDADFNVAIRTIVASSDKVTFGVGGGIVADSDPEAERVETLSKARALFDAVGLETPDR